MGQNQMTPGEALDWMIANPGKELVDSNNEKWRVGSQFIENNHVGRSNGWVPANFNVFMLDRTFRIPDRALPKLPEGCEWGDTRVRDMTRSFCYHKAGNTRERDIYAALVEEFDTRPK